MTLYPSTTPPQTTAIYRDFKKSTAISKGYNVGLRYIKYTVTMRLLCPFFVFIQVLADPPVAKKADLGVDSEIRRPWGPIKYTVCLCEFCTSLAFPFLWPGQLSLTP
jgi:hypothetical protein